MNEPEGFDGLFAPEDGGAPAAASPGLEAWRVLLADDDPDIHAVLRLALQDVTVEGHALQLMDAYSGAEARRMLAEHPDTALVVLDVVMETEHAGLDLVRYLRRELDNQLVQILVVTGQPGYAPKRDAVVNYEINGYRLKSELTNDRLFVSVYTALRARQHMLDLQRQQAELQAQTQTLQSQRQHLEHYQQHLEQLVLARTAELERSARHLAETQFAMDRAGLGIAWTDFASNRLLYVNDEACRQLGYSRQQLLTMQAQELNPELDAGLLDAVHTWLSQSDHAPPFETLHRRQDGSIYPAEVTLYRHAAPEGDRVILFFSDITDRRRAAGEAIAHTQALEQSHRELEALNARLTQVHTQLLQSEKMASIGQLAAGIAHEINNPVGYVKSNLHALTAYVEDFQRMFDAYAAAEASLPAQAQAFAQVRRLSALSDFAYQREDIRALLAESASGLERVVRIVQDLKNFARADAGDEWSPGDLHQGLESTLNVIWNQLKYSCELRREYGALPLVECHLPQLNQVFMNLLLNAAQAIEGHGTVTIATGTAGDEVWVEVADTGKGIAPEHLKRVFEPFFTTKPVGAGTGLGLSVSYSIVQRHHGRIEVDSTPGLGSRFRVRLPVRQPAGDRP